YDLGWAVYVDGVQRFFLRINFSLQGVAVGSGNHNVIFQYKPQSFSWGLFTSVATLVIMGFLLLLFSSKGTIAVRTAIVAVILLICANGIRLWSNVEVKQLVYIGYVELDAREVFAGKDVYTLKIPELTDSDVLIEYSVDDGATHVFTVHLDDTGQIRLNVK